MTLYLTVPRGVAGWTLLNAELGIADLRRGGKINKDELDRVVAAYAAAARWVADGGVLLDLAYAQLVERRVTVQDEKSAAAALAHVERNLSDGLLRSPIHADSWRWLAVIRLSANKDRQGALAATRMSIFTGPYVQYLIIPRIALCLQLWDIYPAEERDIVYQQIRYAASWISSDPLIEMAAKANNVWPFRIAFAQNPAHLAKFEQELKRYLAEHPKR